MTAKNHEEMTDSTAKETKELTVSRVVEAPADRVYEAFVEPEELAQWMHPTGFETEVHTLEAREGGSYHISMSGTTEETAEHSHSYTGTFEDLVPGERLVQTEIPEAEAPGMEGEMRVTITFEEELEGTDVTVNIAIPAAWPDEAIGGWADALENLAAFLETA